MTEVFSQTVNIGNRINETDHNRGTKWERIKLKKFTSVIFPNLITKASISARFPTITKETTIMSRYRNDKFIARSLNGINCKNSSGFFHKDNAD